MESDTHLEMKRTAQTLLEQQGFKTELEKGKKGFRVDVHGEKDEGNIAVEVGHLSAEKKDKLERMYDSVIHIPYSDNNLMNRRDDVDRSIYSFNISDDLKEKLDSLNAANSAIVENLLEIYFKLE